MATKDNQEQFLSLSDYVDEVVERVEVVEEKLDDIDFDAEISALKDDVASRLEGIKLQKGPKGDKGDRGDKGDVGLRGPKGLPGQTPTEKEIKALIPKPVKGDKGDKGEPGKDVKIGDILARIPDLGRGGAINRQIFVGGVDALKRYSDINFKAGANVTLTFQNNNQTQKTDITIAATGGGGGSGITRSINSVAVDTIAGASASVDYVYLVSGTTTITLPTAVGNTNLYTVKNVGTGVVTVNTTLSETIDGSLTITMPVQYTSIDIESDSANWNIT